MSWRFRKSFRVLPGVRLNLSRSGISTTIGAAPFSFNIGPPGAFSTISAPGSGLSLRTQLRDSQPADDSLGDLQSTPFPTPKAPVPVPPPSPPTMAPIEEIRSASTQTLSSEGLEEFRRLLRTAQDEYVVLEKELAIASRDSEQARNHYRRWQRGFVFKHLRKARFAQLKINADTAAAKCDELLEQLRLTTLVTEFDIPHEQTDPFYRLCDAFAALAESKRIWDTLTRRASNGVTERTVAKETITREAVVFRLGGSDLITWNQQVPHLENKNGGDLFIYPGFILYRVSKQTFAVIDTREVMLTFAPIQFIEEEPIPSDSQVVGQTWLKTNKDGSPDRRFRDNRQIPIALYGALRFKSERGLQEEYQVSNADRAEQFTKAWASFQSSFDTIVPERFPTSP